MAVLRSGVRKTITVVKSLRLKLKLRTSGLKCQGSGLTFSPRGNGNSKIVESVIVLAFGVVICVNLENDSRADG